ncbi:MAG: methyl-accepting chemotaxis protein [Motiliproteus sp.]|nr:methyl-accepting chemotaxis protein [Motiliproteus sp.]MCW9053786.1 methyl-accepting chemotaxis protein [Motiliproteus sp.]
MAVHKRLTVRQLLYTNSLMMQLLLLLCSGVALYSMNQIRRELEGISKLDIPLTANITQISEHQLQQSLHFERAMRFGSQGDGSNANLKIEIAAYEKYSTLVKQEIVAAEQLADDAITAAHTKVEQDKFRKVLAALKQIEIEHREFDSHSRQAFDLLDQKQLAEAQFLAFTIAKEEDQLNHELEALVLEISQFTKHAADLAEQHEKEALWTQMVLALAFLVIGLSMSFYISRSIWSQIGHEPRQLNTIAQQIAQGDLTMATPDSAKEVGVYASFGDMLANLKSLIDSIQQGGEQVLASSYELATVSEKTNQHLDLQHQSTDQVATAITEMSATVEEVARNTTAAADAAVEAKQQMAVGSQLVEQTVGSVNTLASQLESTVSVIGTLEEDASQITNILDVIKGIADQTNLLALNAAIEAARAGEQGRGFAVVADEVRSLAQSTQESASEIEEMISKLQVSANSSVDSMRLGSEQAAQVKSQSQQVARSLLEAQSMVDQISDMNVQIASAAEEQKAVSADMSQNAIQISDMSRETGEGARRLTVTSEELAQLSMQLQENIKHFKLTA